MIKTQDGYFTQKAPTKNIENRIDPKDDVFRRVRESLDAGWEYRLNMDTLRYEGRINGSEWQALM